MVLVLRKIRITHLTVVTLLSVSVVTLWYTVVKDAGETDHRAERIRASSSLLHRRESRHKQQENSPTTEAATESLIKILPVPYNEHIYNFTFDNVQLYPCVGPQVIEGQEIEDFMCMPRPNYLPSFKNPCFKDENGKLNCLPYYHILGFDKCGTTDFSFRLRGHPSILSSDAYMGKEIYYWAWRRYGLFCQWKYKVMTVRDYSNAFYNATVKIAEFEGQPNQPIVGDGGPVEAWDFRAWPLEPQNKGLSEPRVLTPHLMRHIYRNPRFFVIMREPAERLYSDYLFYTLGSSPEDFHTNVSVALEMMTSCLKVNTTQQCFFSDLYLRMPLRLHMGCYGMFLREWLAVFHRKHFFFLCTEDYGKDIKGTLQAAFKFLEVGTLPDSMMETIIQRARKFQNSKRKNAGPMFEKTRKLLQEFYAPCNAYLADVLGDKKYLWQDT